MAEYKSIYTGQEIDTAIGKAYTALQEELEPMFNASASKSITSSDITNWDNKSEFSGDYDDLTNKPTIPTTTSQLTNNSGFITNLVNDLTNYYLKSETYTKSEVNTLIGSINQFHYEVVQTLPTTGENNILYLVPKTTSQTNNVYDEYVYSNGWEKIGDTEIDLSNYQTLITSSNKLLSDLVDDTNQTNKFVSATDIANWNGKVSPTDYASDSVGGVIKTATNYATNMYDGKLYAQIKTYNEYNSGVDNMFISKGTLENAITGKQLVNQTYVDGLIGNINTILATLTTPGGNE